MKEHPILFSGEMVRALLDGRKTQTRRVIWPINLMTVYRNSMEKIQLRETSDRYLFDFHHDDGTVSTIYGVRPKYHIGDRLWVRETWAMTGNYFDTKTRDIPWLAITGDQIAYRATCNYPDAGYYMWRPPIYMPRWASRITLEVVNVWVERVQEISHEDAFAEGSLVTPELNNYGTGSIYKDWFANLWDSINAKRGYSWDVNPYVWVVEFKVQP